MRIRTLFTLSAAALAAVGFAQLPKQAHERHEYDLLDVHWEVAIDFSHGALSGEVTNTVSPLKDDAALVFDANKLTVLSVEADGKPATFESNGTVVQVRPAAPVRKGKSIRVLIKYRGEPEAGIYFVPAARAYPAKTDIVYTQGEMVDNRYWLPTYDWPDDKATSSGTITVPAGWSVLSNGKLVGVTTRDGQATWRWKMDQAHATYLISLVAGPYTEVKDRERPIPVSFWVPKGLEEWGSAAFGGTDKIVDFYGRLTGVMYPYAKYSQSAVADFMFGGMENVTSTTQTISALHPKSVQPNVDSTGLVAHELAHQWFGDLITTPTWDHAWINEGWATFLPVFWAREKYGKDAFDVQRFGVFEGGLSAHRGAPTRSMIWSGWTEPIQMFDGFAYPGGASRMFMLMHMVGEDRFWPAVTSYLKQYRFKNVDTEGFFASMSKSLGVNLDDFRKQWFYTPAAPTLTLRRAGDSLTISQGPTRFKMPLDVWTIDSTNHLEKLHFDTGSSDTLEIPNAKGKLALIDPEVWLMTNVSYEAGYTADEWSRLLTVAPNLAQKLRLVGPAFAAMSPAERLAAIRRETAIDVRQRMMGEIDDVQFLITQTHDKDDRIVEAATSRLGNTAKSPSAVARLRELWESTPNDVVKVAALRSLYLQEPTEELLQRAYRTDGFNDGFRLFALDAWSDGDPDRARERALEAYAHPNSEPVRLAAVRILGKVKDRPGERRVFNLLAELLKDRSNSPLRAAIGALAQYGDKAAIPLLQARANHSLVFVRTDVQSALDRLSK